MRIKEEYLDTQISCPWTSKTLILRFVDRDLYKYLYDYGYQSFFEFEDSSETDHLLSTESNTEILTESIQQVNEGSDLLSEYKN